MAYSAQDIQHEAPARAYGVAFGIYIVEGPTHAHILSHTIVDLDELKEARNNLRIIGNLCNMYFLLTWIVVYGGGLIALNGNHKKAICAL